MNFKKTAVTALAIPVLAFSISGMASAKEITPQKNETQTTISPGPIKAYYDTFEVRAGGSKQLDAKYLGSGFAYHSDNSAVFTVDTNGLVRGNKAGNAYLTIFKNGSVYGQLHVFVY
ncbi:MULTISPECIES: Ig-like domain-containing protein [Bacillus]|uniref:Ig-like domain-containing protein n=1 Tax=Bacillus TaxID=1386 RepID=UPI00099BB34A|nr:MULTISPECIES: Ig-like domain-containing protein [Bacillus]ASZ05136.1 hypothetical protein CJP14_15355 [Bacillus velezensis]MBD0399232.1 Ig-like domain-containing protein [Bacillus sp. 2211]MCB5336308.1 putative protein YjdB [Bacillus amyloliquefaciens]MCC5596903.1 Ig-like domain-containing protein [Bacillus velezensis]MCF6449483.1 Ig-like domain-containing protein [Bacillus sp. MMG021]